MSDEIIPSNEINIDEMVEKSMSYFREYDLHLYQNILGEENIGTYEEYSAAIDVIKETIAEYGISAAELANILVAQSGYVPEDIEEMFITPIHNHPTFEDMFIHISECILHSIIDERYPEVDELADEKEGALKRYNIIGADSKPRSD